MDGIRLIGFAILVAVGYAAASCGKTGGGPQLPPGSRPVAGRTSTKAGVSLDFPKGWYEVPVTGPTTASYKSSDQELVLGVADVPSRDQLFESLVDGTTHRMSAGATVLDSGPFEIDTNRAFRIFVDGKTESGHRLGCAVIIERRLAGGRVTFLQIGSNGDAIDGQRQAIENLLATVRVDE